MLEYTYDEAIEVLQTSLTNALEKLVSSSSSSSSNSTVVIGRGLSHHHHIWKPTVSCLRCPYRHYQEYAPRLSQKQYSIWLLGVWRLWLYNSSSSINTPIGRWVDLWLIAILYPYHDPKVIIGLLWLPWLLPPPSSWPHLLFALIIIVGPVALATNLSRDHPRYGPPLSYTFRIPQAIPGFSLPQVGDCFFLFFFFFFFFFFFYYYYYYYYY